MKQIEHLFIILLFLVLLPCFVNAQNIVIKGKITDESTSEPLPYVNIGVKDQAIGTFSDSNGAYRFELPRGEYDLIISSVGYEKEERHIRLEGKRAYIMDIALQALSQELSTVVVSASKYAQKIQESISSIEVLKARSIEISNLSSVDKAVDRMPGITVVDNEPQIRGGSGFSSGLGSRVMVMVDEIPLLRGDAGRPDWALLPIDDLDQIEIVKGASSVVYGSSAINGAINVRTSWPKADPETKINFYTGMYSKPDRRYATPWTGMNPINYGLTITHSQRFDNIDFSGGASYLSDQSYIGGTPENKASDTIYNNGQFEKRVKLFFNSRVRNKKVDGLSYGLNGTFMYSEAADTYFWYDADTNLYRSFPGSLSLAKTFTFYLDPFVKYFAKNGDYHALKNRVYYLNTVGLFNQSSLSVSVYNEYQYTHKFKNLGDIMLVTGVMNNYSYAFGKVFSGQLAPDGTVSLGANGTYTSDNFAVYAQLEKKFFKRLTVLFGARYEYYQLADITENKPVFRAGLNMQAAKGTFLRASVGQGYRVPSIGERYITTTSGNFGFYPNPGLISEQSVSYEVGIKQLFKFGKFVGIADLAGFYEDYDNYVEFNFGNWGKSVNPEKNVGFKFFNTGPARIYGIDLTINGEGNIAKNVNLGALIGYTYSIPQSTDPNYVFYQSKKSAYTYLSTSSDTSGNILKYRVQSIFKGDIQLTYKRFSTGFSGRYYGFMKNIDKFFYDFLDGQMFGVKTGIKKYREEHSTGTFILDFRVSYALKDFKFSVLVNNLFNTEFSLRPLTIESPRMTQVQVTYKI
ncbi:MAG: TonB-dependent receptor [Bacteroidales bacterium]|nr:TonB-dependent receptor [Bacteroidales bacterium]MDD4603663.1 TonB-dependent receptor [Bacteroidales bacterium]